MKFTEELEKHIERSGLSHSQISIHDTSYMGDYNYPDFIRDFLFKYGGLTIAELIPKNQENQTVNKLILDISLTEGVDGISGGYGEFLGVTLYPIGVLKPDSFDVAIDEKGFVYLVGEYLYCCGKNIYGGLENIIRRRAFDTLELDPTNDNEAVWLEYKDGKSRLVDLDSYEFNYDF